MAALGCCLFETAIGRCGVAWTDRGVIRFAFPEGDDPSTLRHLTRGLDVLEALPPPVIQALLDRVQSLLAGGGGDLTDAPLDFEGVPEFHRRVYEAILAIPPGHTLTYGEVARRLGVPGAAQAVGQALGRNPLPLIVPCHRVLGADGWRGGFSAPGGLDTKVRLLLIEGVDIRPPPDLFDI